MDELVVTQGRAYQRGDVILLRYRNESEVTDQERDIVNTKLDIVAKEFGVGFVLLGANLEIVEPEEPSDG